MRPIEILLVEDSPTDRLIAEEALKQARVLNSLNVVQNGVEAMAYLRREGKFASVRRPDLILLDLNLPKKDGREVLAEIKEDPLLRVIPVVVLTTSKADEDILSAYGSHANSYITKPVDFPQFSNALRTLENYWFEVVTLPSDEAMREAGRRPEPRAKSLELEIGQTVELLLAEDNPADALLIKDALSESPMVKFSVTHVTRLADLRERLKLTAFDVVLTDLGLPDSQGLETYRRVRSCASGLPVIVLTGLDDEAMGMEALREGASEYLVKGEISGGSLARVVRYAIEKRGIEERLRQAQKMEAIGQLAAGVAHDFNNILMVIRGRAELMIMKADELTGFAAESAAEIRDATVRAASLTRQLLTFSRQQVMQAKSLDLNVAVGGIGKLLRRVLGEEVALELQLGAGEFLIEADLGMIEQVVLNLAVNARDAMSAGGKLSLRTSERELSPAATKGHPEAYAGYFACLEVTDTGCGMPPEVVQRIFEPFFTTKDIGKGTGLGLATVLGIVQQHRGWVEVTSRVGHGSTFSVFMPAVPRTPKEEPVVSDEVPRAEASGGSETILLVEDEEAVRTLTKTILEMKGYHVIEAGSGAEGVRVAKQHPGEIKLLLTDMIMPDGMTGRQLAEHLTGQDPKLKVLFCSGYSQDFTRADLPLEEGVNFLQKPYEMGYLTRTVRSCLDRE